MGTAVTRSSAEEEIYKRASAYRMPTFRLNGNDLFEVRALLTERLAAARETSQPSFIEAVTYRYRGHSMSDPGSYRSKEEVEAYKARDPIGIVGKALLDRGLAAQEELDAIDRDARAETEDAVAFAEASPLPEEKDLRSLGGLV